MEMDDVPCSYPVNQMKETVKSKELKNGLFENKRFISKGWTTEENNALSSLIRTNGGTYFDCLEEVDGKVNFLISKKN
jgi:hypothetical protein